MNQPQTGGEGGHPRRQGTRRQLRDALEAASIPFLEMESADGWALLAPSLGAKVLGFGIDDENAFWTAPVLGPGQWLVGGQRTWIAPEMGPNSLYFREGRWSPPGVIDPAAYRLLGLDREESSTDDVQARAQSGAAASRAFACDLEVDSASDRHYRLSLERSISMLPPQRSEPRDHCARLLVTHSLVNRDPHRRAEGLALWSIVQVPNLRGARLMAGVLPEARFEPSRYFGEPPADWIERRRGSLIVRVEQGRRFKIGVGAAASAGWLCALRPSGDPGRVMVVVKRFAVDSAARYVDMPEGSPEGSNGDAAQIYNDPQTGDAGFSEIECHSPSRPIEPGGRLSHRVELCVWKVDEGRLEELLREETGPNLDLPPG